VSTERSLFCEWFVQEGEAPIANIPLLAAFVLRILHFMAVKGISPRELSLEAWKVQNLSNL